jgi:hypothetical protein
MAVPPPQLPANPDGSRRQGSELPSDGRSEQSLIPLTDVADAGSEVQPMVLTAAQACLPVQVQVTIPVRDFRVRNLLGLACSNLVESAWDHEADVPLASGDVQLAWSEFEVVDAQLAVRVTRLA